MNKQNSSVWYKEPWPWFFFGLLAVSVVFSLIFVFRSLSGADDVVVGDYYKEGLGINERIEQQRKAQQLQVSARLSLTTINDAATSLVIDLSGADDLTMPPFLTLRMMHPVEANFDVDVVLTHRDNQYIGEIDRVFENRWYLRLEDPEQSWMLNSESNLSFGNTFSLTSDE